MNENSDIAFVSAFRPKHKTDFGEEEQAFAQRLWPHLRRAVQIRQRLELADGRDSSFVTVLDGLPVGVFLLNASGRILHLNRAARELLEHDDGLTTGPQGPEAGLASEQHGLHTLVGNACAPAGTGGLMAVSRRSGKRPYQLLVTPMRLPGLHTGGFEVAATVFVSDPEDLPRLPVEGLKSLYGLTPAEARLAGLLAIGTPIVSCAEQLGITRETARGNLKRVFSKTGTSRQAELVHLLLNIPQGGNYGGLPPREATEEL